MRCLTLFAIALVLLTACKKSSSNETEEETMQYIEGEQDSTQYGIAIQIVGDSLHWISEEGDSLATCIGGTMTFGDLDRGNRIALLYEPGNKRMAKTVIDVTELMGRWVEPDAVDEGSMHGFELEEGGAATSINSRANHYVSWRIFNGKLLLKNSLDGIDAAEIPEDTFTIKYLTMDSLRVAGNMTKFYFRRSNSNGDANGADESQFETYDSPDADAFDPEGEAPENKSEEIQDVERDL